MPKIAPQADVTSTAIPFSDMIVQTITCPDGTVPPDYFKADMSGKVTLPHERNIQGGWRVLGVYGSEPSNAQWARVIQTHELPERNEAKAALGNLLDQVYQMQGMFDDSDGQIAEAVAEAEAVL